MSFVIAFTDDLMFLSRIREVARGKGVEVRAQSRLAGLLEECQARPRLVVLDLDSTRVPTFEALKALKEDPQLASTPLVGYFSHVETEAARKAREAGCARVFPRSTFFQALAGLVEVPPSAEDPKDPQRDRG